MRSIVSMTERPAAPKYKSEVITSREPAPHHRRRRVAQGAAALLLAAGASPVVAGCANTDVGPQVAHGKLVCLTAEHDGREIKIGGPREILYNAGSDQSRTWAAETTAVVGYSIGKSVTALPTPKPGVASNAITVDSWVAEIYNSDHNSALFAGGDNDLPSDWAGPGAVYKSVDEFSLIHSTPNESGGVGVDSYTTFKESPYIVAVRCSNFDPATDDQSIQHIEVPPQATVVGN